MAVHGCTHLHHGCASSTPCPHHPLFVSWPLLLCCMLPHLCHMSGCYIAHWHHLKHIVQAKSSEVHHPGHHSCMTSLSIKSLYRSALVCALWMQGLLCLF